MNISLDIKKIKCISDIHIIFKLNEDYIIGFSKKYISFIFIKTKEIVQIIDFSNYCDFIYIKTNNIYIMIDYYIEKLTFSEENKDILEKSASLDYGNRYNILTILNYIHYEKF